MNFRSMGGAVLMSAAILVSDARGVDVLVTADANLSALATADDTVLRWTGNFTVTVDSSYTGKTIAGIDAGSFTAVIAFGSVDRKVILGNTAGSVLFQANGGDIQITGAGTGVRTAGFLVSPSITGETIEVRAAIDDAVNANHWIIGNNTLQLTGTTPQVGTVDIGFDSGVAKLDVDETGTVSLITPTGDFTMDVAAAKTLSITQAMTVGANTLSIIGGSSSSTIADAAQITLDNASSVLEASGTITVNDLDISAAAKISLLEGATLTLTDAVSVGAQTLTLAGTTGSVSETITATGGFLLDNASSVLKVNGDSADALVVSKIDTSADLTVGKGLDVDEDLTVTALGIAHNATLDVATGKTLGGTVTLKAAKTLTLNNSGTVTAITANTTAGTVNLTGAGTITTLTNDVAGTTVDVDATSTITTMTVSKNTTVNVASGKTLTSAATVAASTILTADGAGTLSDVNLNGTNAELNMTGGGTVSTLTVKVDGGILDVDASNCTINSCVMNTGVGDLTVENASRTISSAAGFDVNDNTLKITEASGSIALVTMDGTGGVLDVDATTTVTALNVSKAVKAQVASGTTLTTIATVSSGGNLQLNETGTVTAITLNASGAELNLTAAGTVNTLTIAANGGVLDVDDTSTVTTVTMNVGVGDLTVDVASAKTLTSTIDVNDNRLTLSATGVPGTILMDTDGGVLAVDATCTPTGVTITADVTVDVDATATLNTGLNATTKTVTLRGAGTISRLEFTTGTVVATGDSIITDLRAVPGTSGTFTYDGNGNSTVTSLSNSSLASSGTFRKMGSGTLTVTNGVDTLFSSATGARVAIDEGGLVAGTTSANHDIKFNDDGDEITVARGASLTTYGSIVVTAAGTNVNLDVEEGGTLNLLSTSSTEQLTALSDNDFQLLGFTDIAGAGGAYTLSGAFLFQFGDIDIAGTAALINETPSSTMEFIPGSLIDLNGSGSAGGTLTVDGQASTTRIVMTTTTGVDTFTIDRNSSTNMTIDNVAISNASYRSDDGGAAIDELTLTGSADVGDNANWFSPAVVDEVVTEDPVDDADTTDGTDTTDVVDDTPDTGELVVYDGTLVRVGTDGSADAGSSSGVTGVSSSVSVTGATSGSLLVTVADGNLRDGFAGIVDEAALPATVRVTSSVTGDFVAVVDFCYSQKLLDDAGLRAEEIVLYNYSETSGLWILAGRDGQYRGDMSPTDIVGDYGYDSSTMCVWVVRDAFSDFAAGVGSTDSSAVSDGEVTSDTGTSSTPPALCGVLGMMSISLTMVGFVALKTTRRRLR